MEVDMNGVSEQQREEFLKWWSEDRYKILKMNKMSWDGWIWEFFRRYQLKQILGNLPVDAMNPSPDLNRTLPEFQIPDPAPEHLLYERLDPNKDTANVEQLNACLYYPWNHSYWRDKKPLGVPRSIHCDLFGSHLLDAFDCEFDTHATQIGNVRIVYRGSKPLMKMFINLDYSNAFIKEDFGNVLAELRKLDPLKRPKPDKKNWIENKTLMVWDLHEFGVSWSEIMKILDPKTAKKYDTPELISKARHRFESALEYIDQQGWRELAYYFATFKKPKKNKR